MTIRLPPDGDTAWGGDVRSAITAVNNLTETPINTQTGTTYTFVLADAQRVVKANNAGAQTYTIPPNSSVAFPVGSTLVVIRYGAGTLTLAAGSGVTFRTAASLTARAQYAQVSAFQIATDEWVIGGDLT